MFAWKTFLASRNVPFREGGRHEVLVHCPFCGENDPSQHLSVSLRGRGWRCLRNGSHKGNSYARLLCNLIACSEEFARDLLGEQARVLPDRDQFSETWRRQLGVTVTLPERPASIVLPAEAKPLQGSVGKMAGFFWGYLIGQRGFTPPDAHWLAKVYRLQYAITGKWAYRILVPIYGSDGALMSWTGRAIQPKAEVRYLSLSAESSVASPSSLVLGLDFLWRVHKPRCLIVTEGPFDAMAISVLGSEHGIWGTCLFGVQITEAQAMLLSALSRKFDRMRLLVDPDAGMKVLRLRDWLPGYCQVRYLPQTLKDPGELPKLGEQGAAFVRELL